jgi:hypothetical protein
MPDANIWDADHPSIVAERDPDAPPAVPPAKPRELSLRHDIYPYEADWQIGDQAELHRLAGDYLGKVAHRFGLPERAVLLHANGTFRHLQGRMQLSWLDVSPSADPDVQGLRHPRRSFWARRYDAGGGNAIDLQLVVLAVPTMAANNQNREIGSRLAIRLNAHVRRGNPGTVAIYGSACSIGLAADLGPAGTVISKNHLIIFMDPLAVKNLFRPMVEERLRLTAADELSFEGYRILDTAGTTARAELFFNLSRRGPEGIAYAVTARVKVDSNDRNNPNFESLAKTPLTACNLWNRDAHPLLRQTRDPTSQPVLPPPTVAQARPTRSPDRLNAFCTPPPPNVVDLAPGLNLVDVQGDVAVMQSRLVNPNANPNAPEPHGNLVFAHPRTHRFGAVHGFAKARELFTRMAQYGLAPAEYFVFAARPLRIRYRETIHPGPGKDGKTVNAAVDYDPPRDEFGGGWNDDPADLRPLQVRFALADMRRSVSRREPLSMAADPRWSWHEYGHVLLAAATGGLELPFAHSTGDALAAIVSDADSRLDAFLGGRMRGVTFPWCHTGRRHDRLPRLGWSWSGTLHRPRRIAAYLNNRLRKGYHSEQILSTSLFNMYRALGGDTFRDVAIRRAAADYAVYLIMRAIQLLPPATAGSAQTPAQFVDALIAADNGTSMAAAGPLANRAGGWARKVVRWAFEAQGLYANVPDDTVHNAPGLPPDVDVFIDDLRPDSDSVQPRGGYMPVQLDWLNPAAGPSWLATSAAIEFVGNRVRVRVRNRGGSAAIGVRTRVWWALANVVNNVVTNPPAWNSGAWTEIFSANSGPQNIPPGGTRQFGLFNGLPGAAGHYLVVAAASCADDPSNIEAPLPVATAQTPIVDLVAGDNNIGLRERAI